MNEKRVTIDEEKVYTEPFDLEGESKQFAFRVIKVYQYLTEQAQKKEYNMSKMLLLKGTSIGDLVRQKDHLGAFNAASSAKYWIEMETNGGYLSEAQSQQLLDDCIRLVRYLYVIVHPESRKAKESQPRKSKTDTQTF